MQDATKRKAVEMYVPHLVEFLKKKFVAAGREEEWVEDTVMVGYQSYSCNLFLS